MPRSERRLTSKQSRRPAISGPGPVSKEQYIQETLESCKDGRCCQDQAALDAAYEQYVNDPKAPWNKGPGRWPW